jgi:hypothetical protein
MSTLHALLVLALGGLAAAALYRHDELIPVKLIIDTDAGLDVDDVVAICVGNALVDNGEAELIALAHTNGFDKGIGGVSSIMHWYNRDAVPLGAYKGQFADSADKQDRYLDDLVTNFSGPVRTSAQLPTAVQVYRKALAAQPNRSVHIASIGITTNMRDLVQSPGDQFSPLTGSELIAQKVSLIVWMSCSYYNFGCAAGLLTNTQCCHGSAKIAVDGIPPCVKQIFTGDLGGDILTGSRMPQCAPATNPCRRALADWPGEGKGRSSWDPLAVALAVRGAAGMHLRELGQGGRLAVDVYGNETWVEGNASNQTYVEYDPEYAGGNGDVQAEIRDVIDGLICQKPGPQ